MSGIYMKIIVTVLAVLAVSFILPDVYAEHPTLCQEQPLIVTSVVTDTSIELFWTEVIQCNENHEVKPMGYTVVTVWNLEQFDTTDMSMLFEGLNPDTDYTFVVVAIIDQESPFEQITVTTNAVNVIEENVALCTTADMQPKNVRTTPTDTTIMIEWDPAFECIDGVLTEMELYNAFIITDEGNDDDFDTSGHIFTGLQPDTTYELIVIANAIQEISTAGVHVFATTLVTPTEIQGNGCSGDCTPPTIGLDKNSIRLVENGFSYNNNPVDVVAWHTPYPLITAIVNQTNTVEIIAYDNGGIFNLDMIQFGLGIEEFGQPLHDIEVLIEVHLEALFSENRVAVEKVVIRDRDNLIDTFSVFAVTETVDCADDGLDNDCLKVTLEYSYREATINNMMGVNVVDRSLNTQNFYLNDGVEVIGESMNPAPFVVLPNKQTSQQTENLTKTLVRTDKVNHIWMDEYGIEYHKSGDNKFDRLTPPAPYTCNDAPLSEINVPTRSNCHFRALVSFWN